MNLDNNIGEIITLDEAVKFTNSFQLQNPDQLKSFFVGSAKLNEILQQDDCIGVRIYNGFDADTNQANRVLVGVNIAGEDISDGIIVERLSPCPPDCPKSSPLIK
ncbi:hypothetical protein [Sphingobacterium siyangense]|uniref:hypothetical protein n=1 Tax=Sphingobacterium siyangense TaxID=459529 RepID=UPI002FDEA33D